VIHRTDEPIVVARGLMSSHSEEGTTEVDPLADVVPVTEVPEEGHPKLDDVSSANLHPPVTGGVASLFGFDVGLVLQIGLCVAIVAYEYKRAIEVPAANDEE
jgi:hypothetical protein